MRRFNHLFCFQSPALSNLPSHLMVFWLCLQRAPPLSASFSAGSSCCGLLWKPSCPCLISISLPPSVVRHLVWSSCPLFALVASTSFSSVMLCPVDEILGGSRYELRDSLLVCQMPLGWFVTHFSGGKWPFLKWIGLRFWERELNIISTFHFIQANKTSLFL